MFHWLFRRIQPSADTMKPEKIIIGLGNPGNRYRGTRHNAGYMTLAVLAKRLGGSSRPRTQFQSETLSVTIAGKSVLLVSPLTYMNASGTAVRAAMAFYKLAPEDLLVICDDVDLPPGKIRVRQEGGSGGQKGLGDILQKLGTRSIARVRVGIGRPPGSMDTADYVLGTFGAGEKPRIESALERAASAAECWAEKGTAEAMNRFNVDPDVR